MSGVGTVWGNVRGVWGVLRPPERRRWLALVPLGAVAAGLEVACAGAVFTLVGALTGPAQGPVADALAALGLSGLAALAGATAALFLAKTGVAIALIHANHRAVEHGRAAVASRLFAGALDAPWTLHLERGVAEAAHDLLGRAGAAFDDVVWPAAQLAVNGVTVLALLALLLAVAPGITLGVGAALVLWLAVIHRLSRRLADRAGQAEDRAQREGLQAVWQTLGALREIRALGREAFFQRRFDVTQAELVRARYVRATLAGLPRVWSETLFVLLMLAVVFALHDAAEPTAAFGVLGLCAYVALRLLPLANGSLWLLGRIRWGTPAVRRLVSDHARLADPPGWRDRPPPPVTGPAPVALEAVRFTWPDGPTVLDGADLRIAAGEAVAVLGATGAGKSTLLHLVAGLVAPEAGRVRVGGAEPRAGQVRVGYVPQEVVLLEGTVADNIALGQAPEDVDRARMDGAVHAACLEAVVAGLPQGLATPIGEGGARLSGGQRQRVALARALYHQPAVLLLDEATAALDAATEAEVVRRLAEATAGKTTLVVVTHRPGAAAGCGRAVAIEGGQIRSSKKPEITDGVSGPRGAGGA